MEHINVPIIHHEITENFTEYCRRDAIERSSKIAALLIEQATKEN